MYEYRARVIHVVDGDTLDLDVSLGFHVQIKGRFRLLGLNTPESFGPDACDAGRAAKAWVQETLPEGTEVIVQTRRDAGDKYGRYLAVVLLNGQSVNDALVSAGHAKPYDGHGVKPV